MTATFSSLRVNACDCLKEIEDNSGDSVVHHASALLRYPSLEHIGPPYADQVQILLIEGCQRFVWFEIMAIC